VSVNEARVLAAIASMRDVFRHQREHDRDAEQRQVAAIHAIAERVKASFEEELTHLKRRLEACLLPVDPLHQTWNVFRLFDLEYEEIRWTQWLAAILRPENGKRCSRIAWSAFCAAVARRAELQPPSGASNLASHVHWNEIAREAPVVEDEVPEKGLGQLDMLVTTPSIVAAVENKLWAHWHDGPKAPQADRYRELANKRLVGDMHRRLGLVLISQREGLKPGDYPADYIHVSWRDLGQELRRALKHEWSGDQHTVIELWPLILTLVSIEQDLLGLSLTANNHGNQSMILKGLSELATYLEGR
jgi:PD-(D/E)XK nuclease superfamily